MTDHLPPAPPVPPDPPSEPQPGPQPGPQLVAPPVAGPRSGAPRNGFARRLAFIVVVGTLVSGGVIASGAHTLTTVADADRTVSTTVWPSLEDGGDGKDGSDGSGEQGEGSEEDSEPEDTIPRGRSDTPLGRLLLPASERFRLGPDIEGFGNDTELTARQAAAYLRSNSKSMTKAWRKEYDAQIRDSGVKGLAMRSYRGLTADYHAKITVTRFKDDPAAHEMAAFEQEIMEFNGFLEKGPEIEGHEQAQCSQRSGSDDFDFEEIMEAVHCTAYNDGLLVTMTAYGTAPLSESSVVDLLRDQLDHAVSPGEQV